MYDIKAPPRSVYDHYIKRDIRLVKLVDIGKEYGERTEEYDREICSLINERGIAMPTTPMEKQLINIHAKNVLKELKERHRGEFSPVEIETAMRAYG